MWQNGGLQQLWPIYHITNAYCEFDALLVIHFSFKSFLLFQWIGHKTPLRFLLIWRRITWHSELKTTSVLPDPTGFCTCCDLVQATDTSQQLATAASCRHIAIMLWCYGQCFGPKEATLVLVVVFRDPQVCVGPHPLRLLGSMFMYLDVWKILE